MTPAATPLPPDIGAQLEQLRDIHLPQPVSWWPLAPGWWLLAGLVLAAILGILVARECRRRSLRYRALGELRSLRGADGLALAALAEQIDVLLKRVVLQRADTRALAATHGDAWVGELTRDPGAMPDTVARFIATAPYVDADRIGAAPDRASLLRAAEGWIRRNT